MKKIHGILKEEEKQRCNECKNEEGDSDNLRDEHQLRLHSPALVLAEESLCAACDSAGKTCGLALLKKDENNNCDRKKKKDYTQYNLMYCHEVDLQT